MSVLTQAERVRGVVEMAIYHSRHCPMPAGECECDRRARVDKAVTDLLATMAGEEPVDPCLAAGRHICGPDGPAHEIDALRTALHAREEQLATVTQERDRLAAWKAESMAVLTEHDDLARPYVTEFNLGGYGQSVVLVALLDAREMRTERDAALAEVDRLANVERMYLKVVAIALACDPIPAAQREEQELEPPWEVFARIKTERDRLLHAQETSAAALEAVTRERDKANAILVSWMLHTPAAPKTLNEYRAHGEAVFASWRKRAETSAAEIARLEEELDTLRLEVDVITQQEEALEHVITERDSEIARLRDELASIDELTGRMPHHSWTASGAVHRLVYGRDRSQEEIARLRGALEFYANEETWKWQERRDSTGTTHCMPALDEGPQRAVAALTPPTPEPGS